MRRKTYWSIINTFLNKCKIPRIPPLLVVGILISDCLKKAQLFNAYFLEQCTPLNNGSCLPHENIFLTQSKLNTEEINQEHIFQILKIINVNKAHGPDNITGRIIELCGDITNFPFSNNFQEYSQNRNIPNCVEICKCHSNSQEG